MVEDLIYQLARDFTGFIVPFTALFAFALPLVSRLVGNKKFPAIYSLIVSILVAFATTTIFIRVYKTGEPIVYAFGGWPPPVGIVYEIDGLNALLGLYAGWLFLGLMIFNIWYNRNLDEPEWYYTLYLGFIAGVLGCFYTGDVFNLFVMIEVLSISMYGLISYFKNNPASLEAAIKYAIIGATTTTIYFIGLVVIYGYYGSLNMGHILEQNTVLHSLLNEGENVESAILASTLAVSLSLWVFTFKAGLFPNHFWIPDVYCESPTPVTAALPALSEIVGLYAVVRFLYTIFPSRSPLAYLYRDTILLIILILGFAGGVVGALMMMIQRDIKRLLGYSSVSHIGLMFMIISINAFTDDPVIVRMAFVALLAHIIAHGLSKVLIFSSSEVFIQASGSKIMDDMRGVGRKYPLISLAFITGFLNLMGAIPFIGFFSKLLMYQSFMSARQILPAIGVIVVSALSIPGYAKAIYALVFSTPTREYGDVELKMFKYFLLLLAIILLILGILFITLNPVLENIVENSIGTTGLYKYYSAFHNARAYLGGGP